MIWLCRFGALGVAGVAGALLLVVVVDDHACKSHADARGRVEKNRIPGPRAHTEVQHEEAA